MSPSHGTTSPARRVLAALGALGLAGVAGLATAAPASAMAVDRPDRFTSAFTVEATPDTIIDTEGNPADGAPGASGTFTFQINSDEEIICWDISVTGAEPPYESPARTATHLHEAAAGETGPPRIAFPNPVGFNDTRTTRGCMQGPFTTGLEGEDGADTGEGFSLAQIEADPAAFSADTHTAEFPAGAVRGQLRPIPVGGVDTGAGGLAADEAGAGDLALLAGATAAGAAALGAVALYRRRETVGA